MHKNILSALFFLALSLIQPAFAETPAQQLQTRLQQIHTMQARFSQKLYDGKGKLLQSSSGSMAIQRPGKFRWDIKKPMPQLMLADGEYLWIYDKSLAQVTVEKLEKSLGKTPADLLSGSTEALTSQFEVDYAKGWFILNPRSQDSMFNQIKLKFNGQSLQNMQLMDNLGQQSDLKFSDVKINSPLNPALFHFSPPRGVDIIRQ